MESKINLTELTNEALSLEETKRKERFRNYCYLIALMVGVALYSTVKNGFSFFTIFPVFFAPILFSIKASHKVVQDEIESRKTDQTKKQF